MAEPSRRFVIGYALALKKQQSFVQPSLVNLAKDRGIDLVKIDTDKPLVDQGPFDCVIHKIHGDDWKKQLDDYSEKNPSSCILDHPEAIERLRNRITMLQVVSELNIQQESETFGIPKQIVVYDDKLLSDPTKWEDDLKFPVIAKPLASDGTEKSHKMSLVFNHDCLTKLNPPIVLQEFVNHGGVIFKVYVVGDFVKCVKRKSLADVPEGKLEGLMSFSQVSNITTKDKSHDKYCKMMNLENIELPPQRFITDIANGLRGALKLNLFNFDVIRDSKFGNRYLVIDINYFPGYSKMPSYESAMTDFFWNIVHQKEISETAKTSDKASLQ